MSQILTQSSSSVASTPKHSRVLFYVLKQVDLSKTSTHMDTTHIKEIFGGPKSVDWIGAAWHFQADPTSQLFGEVYMTVWLDGTRLWSAMDNVQLLARKALHVYTFSSILVQSSLYILLQHINS